MWIRIAGLSYPVFCVVLQARPTFAKKWKWVWLARLFSVEGKMASTLYVHPRKQDLLNGSFVTSREQKQYCKIPTILPLSSRSMDRLTLNNRRGWIQGHSRLIFSFWSSARVCLSWFHSWGLCSYLREISVEEMTAAWFWKAECSSVHSRTSQTPFVTFRSYYRDVIEQQVKFLIQYERDYGYKRHAYAVAEIS